MSIKYVLSVTIFKLFSEWVFLQYEKTRKKKKRPCKWITNLEVVGNPWYSVGSSLLSKSFLSSCLLILYNSEITDAWIVLYRKHPPFLFEYIINSTTMKPVHSDNQFFFFTIRRQIFVKIISSNSLTSSFKVKISTFTKINQVDGNKKSHFITFDQ